MAKMLTAMMCLRHPGSGVTLLLTGSDAFQMICRLDPEMADTAPTAMGAVTSQEHDFKSRRSLVRRLADALFLAGDLRCVE